MISIKEAQKILVEEALSLSIEHVPLTKAISFVLAKDIFADRDYPPFNRSLMDGFALRSSDYKKYNRLGFSKKGEIFAGEKVTNLLSKGNCMQIMTGAPVPQNADIVIPIEDVKDIVSATKIKYNTRNKTEEEKIFLLPKAKEILIGQNIARQGEDIEKGKKLYDCGHQIKTSDIATLASLGIDPVPVFQIPKCSIYSTGNEIVGTKEKPSQTEIRDSNTPSLIAHLSKYNVQINKAFIKLKDEPKKIEAFSDDIIIFTGGVSMGKSDFLPKVLDKMGVKSLFHKVNIKPSKPIWFGKSKNGSVIFALPGNNFSVQVAFRIFIDPFLRASFQMPAEESTQFPLYRKREKLGLRPEYFPCFFQKCGNLDFYTPQSSGDIRSVIHSQGLAYHPSNQKVIKKNQKVDFIFW